MLYDLINAKKNEWLNSSDCSIKTILDYISNKGELRDTQIEAIETYLFLKLKCNNTPLWRLFAEGLFNTNLDLNNLHISQSVKSIFENNKEALSFYQYIKLRYNNDKKSDVDLEKIIIENSHQIDFIKIIKQIFYNNDYPDYLFSLPMGAGKTFLMASFIYLDLYFALTEPDNKLFAHNFIILVPSGLKSSIIPSLKTIEKFDPSWIIPEPAASNIKRMLKFEVLDQPKTAKKSNKTQNPNAQKIGHYQPYSDLKGLVMVVNAEKVILDRIILNERGELFEDERTEDDIDKMANELRNLIGKIPNLSIFIDEVHHAATDDIKLRQVVNKWNKNGIITNVLGFSGTPYLSSPDKINITGNTVLKFSQITNTVYYYSLTKAIRKFLKKPKVEIAYNLEPIQIIEKGVKDFYSKYNNKYYENGTCAKLAIYCGQIERLEEEVYPYLIGQLKISPAEILKYHKGNKKYKFQKENELDFNSLDIPETNAGKNIKIILLVQVGKEGWDCRSLTGVILSQKNDSPTNMVLQTSCRCLRQVDKNKEESAIIWLNDFNAQKLNEQLKEEQKTSIEELNNISKNDKQELINQVSRLEYLQLPKFEFYQLKVNYNTIVIEENPNTSNKIENITDDDSLRKNAFIVHKQNLTENETKSFLNNVGNEKAVFNKWVFDIYKEGFNTISFDGLLKYNNLLKVIFDKVTYKKNNDYYFNELFNQDEVKSIIRKSFYCKRTLTTESEVIPQTAQMLIASKLKNIPKHEKIYPDEISCKNIIEIDKTNADPREALEKAIKDVEEVKKNNPLIAGMIPIPSFSEAVFNKNESFHYLPYNFFQSSFELNFLKEALTLDSIKNNNLELYYNGDRFLTDFHISCYSKTNNYYKYIGKYTPDFLLIKRKDKEINKLLIIETKGEGFSEQKNFLLRRKFIESDFIKMNNDKFGYQRFKFLYFSDNEDINNILYKLTGEINNFFMEE